MTLQAAVCAWATAGVSSRGMSTATTMDEQRLTLKRFMLLLTLFCSPSEQVTRRQSDQGCHGDALASCQHDGQVLAATRCRASIQSITAVASYKVRGAPGFVTS